MVWWQISVDWRKSCGKPPPIMLTKMKNFYPQKSRNHTDLINKQTSREVLGYWLEKSIANRSSTILHLLDYMAAHEETNNWIGKKIVGTFLYISSNWWYINTIKNLNNAFWKLLLFQE